VVLADHGDSFVDPGAFGVAEPGHVALDAADEPPDPGDLFLGGGGISAGPLVGAVDGGGEPFPGAQQVIEVGGQVGEVGDVRKWSQPAQRNRTGQAPPPAATLDGSVQRP